MLLTQKLQLPFVFDSFGSHRQIKAFCHLDDCRGYAFFVAVKMQIVNKAAIDLEFADGKLLEIAETRIAGSKIIDGEFDAQRLQLTENLESHILSGKKQALGYFKF